ncbi:MAG: SDR family NAD(P)-dependent oxidoreductase [Muribaculaceae bacterium]|nr:SDR family NAD(P)-dependent oxidoreductase [Muribaculaceae bacterium]
MNLDNRKRDLAGKRALVTGASSGIGLCFCRELASRGCSLVMVSNQECLYGCAAQIAEEFGVEAYPLFCDLTAFNSEEKIAAFVEAKGMDPDFLINNAGIFSFRPIADTPERKIDCFIDLHVRAVTDLSRLFAIRFAKRGHGRILNMSSMSCWMPMPGIAMYSATKAYIRVFSRALHYEMKDAGVSVTVACPGGIATDLFGLPDNLKKLAVRIGALQTPERFVHKAVGKMLRGKKQYINGWLNRFSILFVAIMPTWVRMLVKRKLLDRNIVR